MSALSMQSSPTSQSQTTMRSTTSPPSRLKARPIPPTNFDSAAFAPAAAIPAPSNGNGWMQNMAQPSPTNLVPASSKPNYNISLAPQRPQAPVMSLTPSIPSPTPQAQAPPPPWMASSVLQPTKVPQWQASGKASNADWADFDPLK